MKFFEGSISYGELDDMSLKNFNDLVEQANKIIADMKKGEKQNGL